MVVLKEENRRLFGEQVNDHIEKLNDLMGLTSGAAFSEEGIRKACLATRLLEGSTRMLGFGGWSGTLQSFRELMEHSAGSGKCWDEQLSQVVSEILETEEQIVAEILAGELDEIGRRGRFDGLLKEIECLTGEPVETSGEPIAQPRPAHAHETHGDRGAESAEHVPTLTRLIDSLTRVQRMLLEYIDKPTRTDKTVRDLEVAFGESEFLMGLTAETLRRLGKSSKPFSTRISCGAVCDGLKDFFGMQLRLRHWNAELTTRCNEFTLDRDIASSLAAILDGCIFDICRRYEVRDDVSLTIGVDIRSEGSYLVAKIQDNAPDYLCDSEIDREDTGAFYQCLRDVRSKLESLGALLWLEPSGGSDGRFKFTLPRTKAKTDHQIFTACGMRFAVPCHAIDSVQGLDSLELMQGPHGRYLMVSGARVPVFSLDELAMEKLEPRGRPDRLLIAGLGEKRIALFVEGQGRIVETVADQVTEGAGASLARAILHIGEEEFPIIDAGVLLRTANTIHGAEDGPEEAGTYADGRQEGNQEVTVPRA